VLQAEAVPEDEPIELTDVLQAEAVPEDEPIELSDVLQAEANPEDEPIELVDTAPAEAEPEFEPIELSDTVPAESEPEDESLTAEPIDKRTELELFDVIGSPPESNGGEEESRAATVDSADHIPIAEETVPTEPPEEKELLEILDLAGQTAAAFNEADDTLADLAGSFLNTSVAPTDSDRPENQSAEDITTTIGMEIDNEPRARTLSDLYQNWESAMEDDGGQAEDETTPINETGAETHGLEAPPPSFEPVLLNDRQPLAVTPEQIEAAVSKVIARMLEGKIEETIVATIEKAVTKEIQRLREALLEDSADS
jgi:hypothetical protein